MRTTWSRTAILSLVKKCENENGEVVILEEGITDYGIALVVFPNGATTVIREVQAGIKEVRYQTTRYRKCPKKYRQYVHITLGI